MDHELLLLNLPIANSRITTPSTARFILNAWPTPTEFIKSMARQKYGKSAFDLD